MDWVVSVVLVLLLQTFPIGQTECLCGRLQMRAFHISKGHSRRSTATGKRVNLAKLVLL